MQLVQEKHWHNKILLSRVLSVVLKLYSYYQHDMFKYIAWVEIWKEGLEELGMSILWYHLQQSVYWLGERTVFITHLDLLSCIKYSSEKY